MRKLIEDNEITTIYHHEIESWPNIFVVEQHFKSSGIIDFSLKLKHFDSYVMENPIRLYTNNPPK